MAIPVRRNGETAYALMMAQPVDELKRLLSNAGLPPHARVVLLDDKGVVIATRGAAPYAVAQKLPLPATGDGLHELVDPDGTSTITASAKTSSGYTVLVAMPLAEAYGTARKAAIGWGLRKDASTAVSGLGIGLALSRTLLTMHGGELAATSAGPGKGSTFTARLPLVDAPEAPPVPVIETRPERPSRRQLVLVVDDNRDGCDMMRELLALSGFEASTAYDGAGALAAVQISNYDALILDIGLPDVDGYELCRRIRGQPGRPPVMIALTGWGQPQDKQAAQNAGFDAHITKPARPDVLYATLTKLLREREQDAERRHRDDGIVIKTADFSSSVATGRTASGTADGDTMNSPLN